MTAIEELVAERGFTAHIGTRGEEIALKLRTPGWRARRWVVEACHSWLNRNCALLIRWSKKDENHLALLQLARISRPGSGGFWASTPERVAVADRDRSLTRAARERRGGGASAPSSPKPR